MAKKAHLLMTLEAMEELLHLFQVNVNIDSISMEDDQNVRLELSGDGLPVDDGSIGEQVKTRHLPDTTKPYYKIKTTMAKRHDKFVD